MANISASLVNQLRARTGLGMMDCKKLLVETDGDLDKAEELARKKGLKGSITERQAGEGKIAIATSPDGKVAVAVEATANTDFTAKSEVVQAALQFSVAQLIANPSADVKANPQVTEKFTNAAKQTGENVQLGRAIAFTAAAGQQAAAYLYVNTGKIAVLMLFKGAPDADLITDIGGHIAFKRPLGLTREAVPADLVAKERDIAVEQAKATGKPQQIAEKIAEGKLNSFFAETVLLDQEFFNPAKFKGSVSGLLKSKGVTLEKYHRIEVGQA